MTDIVMSCPICGANAEPLDKVGDADGFDCPRHETFKVSGTVMETKRDRDASQWEAALRKAKARIKPGEWPLIVVADF